MTDSTSIAKSQDPLVPADVAFPSYTWAPLDIKVITEGDLSYLSGDGFKAAITLLMKSWQEKPAASLPNDPKKLAAHCGFGRSPAALDLWEAVKDEALSDFTLCSDGRWYSRTLTPHAIEAWESRQQQIARTKKARETRAENRRTEESTPASATSSVTESVTQTATTSVIASIRDDIRGEERRSEERRSDGRRSGATSVKVEAGGKGGAGGSVRPKDSHPRRAWRATQAFVGANVTIPAGNQNRWAAEFTHIEDVQAAMREIEPALSGVPKDARMGEMKARLAARNNALAESQSSRQGEEADCPF
ncbi:DUF1376 domain-containing protein [Methylobacterium sp. DB1607]|nr:DUF1376 domain-containing protein [Methylobacterium sp. DB1607]